MSYASARPADRTGRQRDPLATLSPAERSDYEERAALMQFDGGLTQPEAERQALLCVLKARGFSWVQQ